MFVPIQLIFALAMGAAMVFTSEAAVSSDGKFNLEVFGSFKQMSQNADASATVRLESVSGKSGTYGVGALAGLRGEILIWDGRVLVSRGHDSGGRVEPASTSDEANLLIKATVVEWAEVETPADMNQSAFESFVRKEAQRRGLVDSMAYPYVVKGRFSRVLWHVVTGAAAVPAAGGGNVHAQGHARTRTLEHKDVDGAMVGFYSGDRFEGVISHPDERFHVHFATAGLSASGHVDEYAILKGSTLLLPLR